MAPRVSAFRRSISFVQAPLWVLLLLCGMDECGENASVDPHQPQSRPSRGAATIQGDLPAQHSSDFWILGNLHDIPLQQKNEYFGFSVVIIRHPIGHIPMAFVSERDYYMAWHAAGLAFNKDPRNVEKKREEFYRTHPGPLPPIGGVADGDLILVKGRFVTEEIPTLTGGSTIGPRQRGKTVPDIPRIEKVTYTYFLADDDLRRCPPLRIRVLNKGQRLRVALHGQCLPANVRAVRFAYSAIWDGRGEELGNYPSATTIDLKTNSLNVATIPIREPDCDLEGIAANQPKDFTAVDSDYPIQVSATNLGSFEFSEKGDSRVKLDTIESWPRVIIAIDIR